MTTKTKNLSPWTHQQVLSYFELLTFMNVKNSSMMSWLISKFDLSEDFHPDSPKAQEERWEYLKELNERWRKDHGYRGQDTILRIEEEDGWTFSGDVCRPDIQEDARLIWQARYYNDGGFELHFLSMSPNVERMIIQQFGYKSDASVFVNLKTKHPSYQVFRATVLDQCRIMGILPSLDDVIQPWASDISCALGN